MNFFTRFRKSLFKEDGRLDGRELLTKVGLILFMAAMVVCLFLSNQWSLNTVVENRQKRNAETQPGQSGEQQPGQSGEQQRGQAGEQQTGQTIEQQTGLTTERQPGPAAEQQTNQTGNQPDLQLTHWNGDRRMLSGYGGNVVFLTFWNQSDPDSLDAVRKLLDIESDLSEYSNLRLLNICVTSPNDSEETVRKQQDELGDTAPEKYNLPSDRSFVDPDRYLSALLQVTDYPTTFLFGPTGKLVNYYSGVLTLEKVRKVVETDWATLQDD